MLKSTIVRPIRLAALAAAALALGIAAPAAAQDRHVKFSGHEAAPRGAESARSNNITQQQSGRIAGNSNRGSPGISTRWLEVDSWALAGSGAGSGGPIERGPGRLVVIGSIGNCRVGDTYRTLELRDGGDGSITKLERVQIAACGGRTVSLDFAIVARMPSVDVIED